MLTPLRSCAEPGCPELVRHGRCPKHARMVEQDRPNRIARRWYYTARWRALRTQVLEENPLCVECLNSKWVEPAIDVDHRIPHNGNADLFFDRSNLQGLCKFHHSQKTRIGL